ncbi:serine/threonine-protein kinase [Okeania hirsuta]|uniref:serine/threonine-protein kinase n=1 Tax=Okeania hirsuta TaxID=1458930 RepID=UPI000F534E97|nr:serine/threonine-protein kinase [Okeania hirsuta]
MINKILRRRYQIISELGKGGIGTTYLAVDLDLPNCPQCVVKQLTPLDPRPQVFNIAKNLFDKEAKILHRLGKHEQIPQLFAYFEEDGQFYLVQEFIEGYDLTKEIYSWNKFLRSRLREDETVQLLTEILSVLKYVHQQNVIHRDLKPENIMRRKSDGKIVLIDFGSVKEIKGLTVMRGGKTTVTIAVGTPGYMPMEQAAGRPKFCSDIYAVGIMAIEALTGVNVNLLPKDISTGKIIWKDRVNVSDNLGRVLSKMMLYDWRHRYHSIDQVMAELRVGSYSANTTTYQRTFFSRKLVNDYFATVAGSTVLNVGNSLQPALSNDMRLVSDSGVDYRKLRDLLAAGKWKEANRETNIVMQKAVKARWLVKLQLLSGLNSKSIKKIPCTDLQTINKLWEKYSNGHFGFRIQKQIYLDTGNLLLKDRKEIYQRYRKEIYQRFGEKIGWKLKRNWGFFGGWLFYHNIIFERNAPRGHLPVLAPISLKKVEYLLILALGSLLLFCFYFYFYWEQYRFIDLIIKSVFICYLVFLFKYLLQFSLSQSHYLICTISKKLDEHDKI